MKDFESCVRLVNQRLNERIKLFSGIDHDFLIKHGENCSENMIKLIPAYCSTFYRMGEFIKIAEVCGCSCFVTCENNGYEMAPCLYIQ